MPEPKILFLYTEIAGYFLAGIRALLKKNIEVHIVRYPVNNEAPFNFKNTENIKFYERNDYTPSQLLNLAKKINPQIIIVSGWRDKAYLKIASFFKKNTPVILTFDNRWEGTPKQYIAVLMSPFFLKTRFSYVWVPGNSQKKYAEKLGFKKQNIYTGFYSADTNLFSEYYRKYKTLKENNFPEKFLFTGRYIPAKNIFLLWEAFAELQKDTPNEWELICTGTGELFDKRIKHPKIKHLGFVQPENIGKIISETGVFILPSKFEPWGVVVHETATAGFPLICSDKVGAAEIFLENEKNGFIFQAGDKEDLKRVLKKIISLSQEELIKMSKISREKSQKITSETWANTIMKFLNTKK